MALKGESGLVRVSVVLLLSLMGSAAAQTSTPNAKNQQGTKTATSASLEQHSPASPKPNTQDDFHRRVEARWKAARKGQIQVYVLPNTADPDRYEVRVVVTRAPLGSDGMTAVFPPGKATWEALLKLDDELRVELTPESAGALSIDPVGHGSVSLIRHLNPGGHAEWIWNVRKTGPGVDRLRLEGDVVYRRNFSPGGQPVVTYPTAETIISVPAPPDHSIAGPPTPAPMH